ncbi:hypothetical protein [Streptomyces aidingensis]|uniref:FtsK domain-containing protein n=1 Tax=Streptomyces aidingensis TaxID=910347 RepID=A0A1I1PVT6_9ACTN|nr:hypothetical protein [Streptomyces aidingensis]SFD13969.1 hypothetical protein SAMN05421773_11086 [Streptomyces aidingensis]
MSQPAEMPQDAEVYDLTTRLPHPTAGTAPVIKEPAPPARRDIPAALRGAAYTTAVGTGHALGTAWDYLRARDASYAIHLAHQALEDLRRQINAGQMEPDEGRAAVQERRTELERLRAERKALRRERLREPGTVTCLSSAAFYIGLAAGAVDAFGALTLAPWLTIPALAAWLAGRRALTRRNTLPRVVPGQVVNTRDEPQHTAIDGDTTRTDADTTASDDARIVAALRDIKLITDAQSIRPIGIPHQDEHGNTITEFTLPPGIVCETLQRKAKPFAGALGLSADRIDIAQGDAEGDVRLWIATRPPFSGPAPASPLTTADRWSVWNGVPFATTRKGERKTLQLLWSSMLFGGAQGYGKTTAMRLPAAAGVLDPHCRPLLADFKGGADWEEMEQVAHTAIIGADPDAIDAFIALIDDLIDEMDRRFAAIRAMPKAKRPDMRITPAMAREHNMPTMLLLIDELQEAFGAIAARGADKETGTPPGKKQLELLVEKLARLIRRGRACGLIVIASGQRPDADSVPTAFRDVILTRYSVHTVDDTSSDMILGSGAARQGVSAAGIGRIGVGALMEPSGGELVQPDLITPQQFEAICARGRELRAEAGTLTGHAAGQTGDRPAGLLGLLLAVFAAAGDPEYLRTPDLLAGLTAREPEPWAAVAAGDPRAAGRELREALTAALPPGRTLAPVERSWGRGYLLTDVRAAAGIATK